MRAKFALSRLPRLHPLFSSTFFPFVSLFCSFPFTYIPTVLLLYLLLFPKCLHRGFHRCFKSFAQSRDKNPRGSLLAGNSSETPSRKMIISDRAAIRENRQKKNDHLERDSLLIIIKKSWFFLPILGKSRAGEKHRSKGEQQWAGDTFVLTHDEPNVCVVKSAKSEAARAHAES